MSKPWKCTRCGSVYRSEGLGVCLSCSGRLQPYERRRADPQVVRELETLIQLASMAMEDANGDGAGYDIDERLFAARKMLATLRAQEGVEK